jgi:hypothetical protein
MPVVRKVPITSVFGEPREGFGRHTFVGGNFFMQRMLNRFRNDLAVTTPPRDMECAALRTIAHLQSEAARVTVQTLEARNGRLEAVVSVENLGGHKLPTAYPARRALHGDGPRLRAAHSNPALGATGYDQNDNDEDGGRFEPHYPRDHPPDRGICETVMAHQLTTGLPPAVRMKDNRHPAVSTR